MTTNPELGNNGGGRPSLVAEFLKTVPIFQQSKLEVLEQLALRCEQKHLKQGDVILQQGSSNDAYFLLRSGRVAERLERFNTRETLSTFDPPTIFGELSCITGKPCSADFEIDDDAEVIVVPRDVLIDVARKDPDILLGLLGLLAGRQHKVVVRGTQAPGFPVVLLRAHPHWQAPASFSEGLTKSLSEQIGKQVLLVRLAGGNVANGDLHQLGQQAFVTDWTAGDHPHEELVQQIAGWQKRFKAIVLSSIGRDDMSVLARIEHLATEYGDLLGPGDPVPDEGGNRKRFVVGSGEAPMLPILKGSRQLLFDAVESERNHQRGKSVTSRFCRTVDSIARHVLNIQIGLACGGGVAWGLAHLGVFNVLEQAGVPIDMVTGTSSGAWLGGMRCCGQSTDAILDHVVRLTRSRLRLFEWRIWKLHLIRESTVRKHFERAFGDIHVNQTEIPFWANALHVEKGEEVSIKDGPLCSAVRASICLPGLFPPMVHADATLIDASLIDAVPLNQVREMGCRLAIATNVMQYLKGRTIGRKYPRNLFPVLYRALQACGQEITEARCQLAADAIIKPDAGTIPMLGFRHIDQLVQAGERAAQEQLPLILAAFNRLKAKC